MSRHWLVAKVRVAPWTICPDRSPTRSVVYNFLQTANQLHGIVWTSPNARCSIFRQTLVYPGAPSVNIKLTSILWGWCELGIPGFRRWWLLGSFWVDGISWRQACKRLVKGSLDARGRTIYSEPLRLGKLSSLWKIWGQMIFYKPPSPLKRPKCYFVLRRNRCNLECVGSGCVVWVMFH